MRAIPVFLVGQPRHPALHRARHRPVPRPRHPRRHRTEEHPVLVARRDDRWWHVVDRELGAVENELDGLVPGFDHRLIGPRKVAGSEVAFLSFMADRVADRFEALLIEVSVGLVTSENGLPDSCERSIVVEIQHRSGKAFASMHRTLAMDPASPDPLIEEFADDLRMFLRQHLDLMSSLPQARRSLGEAGQDWCHDHWPARRGPPLDRRRQVLYHNDKYARTFSDHTLILRTQPD